MTGISAAIHLETFLDSDIRYGVWITEDPGTLPFSGFAVTALQVLQARKSSGKTPRERTCSVLDLRMIGDFAKGKNLTIVDIVNECLKKYTAQQPGLSASQVLAGVRDQGWLIIFDHADAVLDHLSSSEQQRFLYQLFSAASTSSCGKVFITCSGTPESYRRASFWVHGGMGLFRAGDMLLLEEAVALKP